MREAQKRPPIGDVVPEYTPLALFRLLCKLPGGVPSGEWLLPTDYLGTVLGCDASQTVLLSVSQSLPEIAAGGRLVVDKRNIAPPTPAYVALVRNDGELRIVWSDRADLSQLLDHTRIAGKICAFLGAAPPRDIPR